MNYPNEPIERAEILSAEEFDCYTQGSITNLRKMGMTAYAGANCREAMLLGIHSKETGIEEYCPNDYKRFGRPHNYRQWMAKNGGHGLIRIMSDTSDLEVMAYGWSGYEENKILPGKDITTAYRVTKAGSEETRLAQKRFERYPSMGLTLGRIVIATAIHKYDCDPEQISLETWQSNERATKLYKKLGFELQESVACERVTLKPVGAEIKVDGIRTMVRADETDFHTHLVDDRRLYYSLNYDKFIGEN